MIRASKSGDWHVDASGVVISGGFELKPGEFTLEIMVADSAGETAMLPGGGFILLDTAVSPELAAEGLARDMVRAVQQAHRAAGLGVSDRISLTIAGTLGAQEAMQAHKQLIARETLATTIELAGPTALDRDPLAGQPTPVGDSELVVIRLVGLPE